MRKKQKDSHHWGDIGWKVEQAAVQCKGIITLNNEESLSDCFERVLPALENLAAFYRQDVNEEDGYALGTVREVENALILQAENLKNASKY